MSIKVNTDVSMPGDWAKLIEIAQSKGVPRKVWSRVHSSMLHYHKAKLLCGVDNEMGFIRLVAAEEEMTVAVFELLKNDRNHIQYAERFTRRFKNHAVKSVLPIILEFVSRNTLRKVGPALLAAGVISEDKPGITFEDGKLHLSYPSYNGRQLSVELNGAKVIIGEDKDISVDSYHRELADEIFAHHRKSLKRFFQDRAARRDNLLYARDGGIELASYSVSEWLQIEYEATIRTLIYTLSILTVNDISSKDGTFLRRFAELYDRILDQDLKK